MHLKRNALSILVGFGLVVSFVSTGCSGSPETEATPAAAPPETAATKMQSIEPKELPADKAP